MQQFEEGLKQVCPEVYETAAPQNATRYVVWHRYGRSSVFGENRNQTNIPKVQIDIVTNIPDDILADDVCAALWLMDIPYSVQSEGYEDELAAYRTILQMVVI